MAQNSHQLDIQVLNDLQQLFPEIPQGVVSQCMLQNNNNLEACRRALAQESSKYLYLECHNSDENRMNRNRLLHINLGIHPHSNYPSGDGAHINGSRTLVHSSSDGHIDPQQTMGKSLLCMVQEPHSAPATVAASPTYNPFFMNDHSRNASTPPPQSQQQSVVQPGLNSSTMQVNPSYMHIPRYSTNPITVTVSQNLPSGQNSPRALQIIPQIPSNHYGPSSSIYVRQASQSSPVRQNPQNTQWHHSSQGSLPHYSPCALPTYSHQNYQQSQYSPKQPQIPQTAFRSPPTSHCPSPFGSPQHQVQPNHLSHQSHVFMPPSPSSVPSHPYQQPPPSYPNQGGHSMTYLPYGTGLAKSPMNKIEITVDPPQRTGTSMNRSPSPIHSQPSQRNPLPLYAVPAPPGSPSRGRPSQTKSSYGVNPLYITYTHPSGPGAPSPSPRVLVTQPNPTVFKITVGRVPTENLLNLVDQEQYPGAPEPIQPISLVPGSEGEKGNHKYQRNPSSLSDDYAYTQALLLHQRARMERLAKALKLENMELEKMKREVDSMEHDLMNRRMRRVTCSTSVPTPEEMTRWRNLNRQLQINIDCTLKEIDLHKSKGVGNLDPKAMSNFYDNLEPGPVVPPKPCKKDISDANTQRRKARRISVTSKATGESPDSQASAADEQKNSSMLSSRNHTRDEDFEGAPWNCDSCTFLNHPALNRCEQCEMPK